MFSFRTGTPPRLLRETICYDGLVTVKGDMEPEPFSFLNDEVAINVSKPDSMTASQTD